MRLQNAPIRPRFTARRAAVIALALGALLLVPVGSSALAKSDSGTQKTQKATKTRTLSSKAVASPSGLTVTGATVTAVSLKWTPAPSSGRYEVLLNGSHWAWTSLTNVTVTGLTCSRTYTFGVANRLKYQLSPVISVKGATAACAGTTTAPSTTAPTTTAPTSTNTTTITTPTSTVSTTTSTTTTASTTTATTTTPSPTPAPAPTNVTCDKTASPGAGTAQALLASLSAGQTGCLHGGTYTASGPYVLDFSKSSATITSYPGERALLRGIVVVRSGANSDQLVSVSVDGDGSQNTIQVYGADFTLRGSDITNTWRGRSCLMLGDASAGTAVRPVIRGNRFHECGSPANGNLDHGIYASHVSNGLITENVFWNSAGYAIQLYPSAQGTVFSHNVVDGIGTVARGGVIIGGDTSSSPSSGNTIEYNVIAYAADYGISSWWGGSVGSNNIARNNCIYGSGSSSIGATSGYTTAGNVTANPLFVDRANHNYRLGAGSPCLAVVGYDAAATL